MIELSKEDQEIATRYHRAMESYRNAGMVNVAGKTPEERVQIDIIYDMAYLAAQEARSEYEAMLARHRTK